jgi:hypothetical protein
VKVNQNDPPRVFEAGGGTPVEMYDCGRIELEPDELVTLATESGAEYDVARKSWGFYATPSLNARLLSFGLRAALARDEDGKAYVLLVEDGQEDDFSRYLTQQGMHVACWFDEETLSRLDEVSRP